jgi:uncharacterized spore protein YtfJ
MMSSISAVLRESAQTQEKAGEQMERLLNTARVESVFGKPVTQGEYTTIVAAEVNAIAGFGFGAGGGEGEGPPVAEAGKTDSVADVARVGSGSGAGSGGAGGGTAWSRPVAVIEIGPNGVRVEPIVDPTKIVLAFLTTFGAMFVFLSRMRRQAGKWGE